MHCWIISSEEDGEKLVNVIQQRLGEGWSRRGVKAVLDRSGCLVNGKIHKHASRKVAKGERIEFTPPLATVEKKGWWEKRTLFEDRYLVVLDKPAGVVADAKETLKELQKRWSDLHLVHRLDRDTTGVWLFARGIEVKEQLLTLFRERKVDKHYQAIVDGVPKRKKGSINLAIQRVYDGDQFLWRTHAEGKTAETTWELERSGSGMALLSCYPKTGRTHQIRLHCKAIGCPILGDYRYTRSFSCRIHPERQLLHAKRLTIPHPMTGEQLSFTSPLPADFCFFLQKMGAKG